MEDNTAVKPGENDGAAPSEEEKAAEEAAKKASESKAAPGGEGAGKEPEPPRRNAEYWKRQQEREDARKARADFFKAKTKKVVNQETGEEHEEEVPLTRAEVAQMLEERSREQETRDLEKSDEISITAFLGKSENERFRKYEAKARQYLKSHPYYPLEGIFRDLAYDDAVAEGAARAVKAKARNERGKVTGSERRPVATGGMPDFSGMKPAERAAALRTYRAKIRKGEASFEPEEE